MSHVKNLLNAPYGKDIVKRGLNSLSHVINLFVEPSHQSEPGTPISALAKPEKNSFGDFWGRTLSYQSSQVAVTQLKWEQLIDREITELNKILLDINLMSKVQNSVAFWNKYEALLPRFNTLFQIIDNIPAASAQIERFFSKTGLVCDKRRLRMTNKLIIMRSMFLANLDILQNLNTLGGD